MPSGMGSPDLLELPCVEAVVSRQGPSHLVPAAMRGSRT